MFKANSGRLVPIAIIVSPMIRGEIPFLIDRATDPFTSKDPPDIKSPTPKKINRRCKKRL